jgi:hypothetical protein
VQGRLARRPYGRLSTLMVLKGKPVMNYQDLGVHAGALVTLIGVFAGVSGLLLWRMLVRMEKKIDEMFQHFCACREDLPERFVPRFEHEVEHQGLWEALNYHQHNHRGRVVR